MLHWHSHASAGKMVRIVPVAFPTRDKKRGSNLLTRIIPDFLVHVPCNSMKFPPPQLSYVGLLDGQDLSVWTKLGILRKDWKRKMASAGGGSKHRGQQGRRGRNVFLMCIFLWLGMGGAEWPQVKEVRCWDMRVEWWAIWEYFFHLENKWFSFPLPLAASVNYI